MTEQDATDNKRRRPMGWGVLALALALGVWGIFFRGDGAEDQEDTKQSSVSLLTPSAAPDQVDSATAPIDSAGRKRPPAAAVKKAFRLQRVDDVRHWGSVLAEEDPARAVLLIDELSREWKTRDTLGELDDALFRAVVQGWSRADVRSAAVWAAQLPRLRRVTAVTLVVQHWGAANASQAVEWAATLPPADRHGAYLVLALQLSEREPAAALALLDKLPEGDVKQQASSRIAHFSSRSVDSLPHALAAIDLLDDGPARRRVVLDIVQRWVPASVGTVVPWLAQSSLVMGRADVFVEMGKRWSATDPDGAAQWADRLADSLDRANALGGVATVLVGVNLEAARALAESLQESVGRSVALRAIAVRWVELDLISLPAWLETLPLGDSRDEAIEAFVTGSYKREPGAALAWAAVIDDETLRQKSSLLAGLEWIGSDPEGAVEWVGSSGLPDDLKAQLISAAE
ncbi:MAG: hypothetical protein O2901_04700 [Verrucomicrobia bacterium]|nr:hypothetical protein [Verrucomicrobiota bacterium]